MARPFQQPGLDTGRFAMIDLAQFHFLRPLWLLAALPALGLALALWRLPGSGANWRRAIAADLLEHLLESSAERRNRWPWLALAGWLLAVVAIAGPTWEKLPQPVVQKRDALVIVLDLSLSMYAEDIKPSRLQRARFKIIDVLQRRSEGLTGLVAYSGDAHVVSPLTDDTSTIANLVPALAPAMMPAYGSDPVAGVDQALQLLRNAGFERGRILLVSDEITVANIDTLAQHVNDSRWQLSVLGVGTEQGAPIPLARSDKNADDKNSPAAGGFLKQPDGQIVVAQLHRARFKQLAQRTEGRYSELHADDRDLDELLPAALPTEAETRAVQREFDQWQERGAWLAMLLLPLAALAFRRGWLLVLLLFIVPLSLPRQAVAATESAAESPPLPAAGSAWRDLWQRPDQQARQALDAGDAKAAAGKFRDPQWRGTALYRSGDYAAAAQALQGIDSSDAQYNRGNALARAGNLQEALDAYDAALKQAPESEDAKVNRELVKKLLEQQKQQQANDSSKKDQSGNDKQNEKNSADSSQQSSSKQQKDGQQSGAGTQDSPPANGKPDAKKSDQQNSGAANGDQNAQHTPDNSAHEPGKNPPAGDQQNAAANQAQQAEQQATDKSRSAAASQNANAQDANQQQAAGTAAEGDKKQQQQQRATEQWLRQIPDDPAGLLRRKFLYEHRQRERAAPTRDNEQPLW
jgi:Ca-activated chloride channel family protein